MNKSSYIQIFETEDYDQFVNILGNRSVDQRVVDRLKKSILKKDMLPYMDIKVNEKNEVIDGQHRLEAARQLGIPIYFKVCPGLSIEDVMDLNVNQWHWLLNHYLKSYSDRGVEDYKILGYFVNAYSFPISVSARILMGYGAATSYHEGDPTSSNVTKLFKEGNFKIAPGSLPVAELFAGRVKQLQPYCEAQVWSSSSFIAAMQRAYKIIDHAKLINKLKKHEKTFVKSTNVKGYLRQIEDIYNFHAMPGNDVRVF